MTSILVSVPVIGKETIVTFRISVPHTLVKTTVHARNQHLGIKCSCTEEWNGRNCDEKYFCYSQPCKNGGVCTNTKDSFICDCHEDWEGTMCEIRYYCHNNPCLNRGICHNMNDSFKCECPRGWVGTTCELYDYCHNQTLR